MPEKTAVLDDLIKMAKQLSPLEKLRLVEGVLPDIEAGLQAAEGPSLKSLHGTLSSLGPAPSAEDIEMVRREMFENFPRTNIARLPLWPTHIQQ
jgi:hypothetical protein